MSVFLYIYFFGLFLLCQMFWQMKMQFSFKMLQRSFEELHLKASSRDETMKGSRIECRYKNQMSDKNVQIKKNRSSVWKVKCPKDQVSKRSSVQKVKCPKGQVSERSSVWKIKFSKGQVSKRSSVWNIKCPKGQVSENGLTWFILVCLFRSSVHYKIIIIHLMVCFELQTSTLFESNKLSAQIVLIFWTFYPDPTKAYSLCQMKHENETNKPFLQRPTKLFLKYKITPILR